jgi:hypothetical protein
LVTDFVGNRLNTTPSYYLYLARPPSLPAAGRKGKGFRRRCAARMPLLPGCDSNYS